MAGSKPGGADRRFSLRLDETETSPVSSGARVASELSDETGYARLFQEYGPALVRYLYGLVGEVETARDLAQETFVRGYELWLDPARHNSPGNWRALLYKISTNAALDWLRRQRKIRFSPLADPATAESSQGEVRVEPPDLAATFSDPARQIETRQAVLETLHQLPVEAATCLLLCYDQGFCSREIALITGNSVEATWQRLSRARRLFCSLYQKEQLSDA